MYQTLPLRTRVKRLARQTSIDHGQCDQEPWFLSSFRSGDGGWRTADVAADPLGDRDSSFYRLQEGAQKW